MIQLCDDCGIELDDPNIDLCATCCPPEPETETGPDDYLHYLMRYRQRQDAEHYALGG